MLTVVVYVVVTLVVAAALYVLSVAVFGRSEELPPVSRGHTLTFLQEGPLTGDDLREVRFGMGPRGYTMSEVDWAVEQAALEIDRLRALLGEHDRAPGDAEGAGGESAPASRDGTTR